jgi:hypothetical protein
MRDIMWLPFTNRFEGVKQRINILISSLKTIARLAESELQAEEREKSSLKLDRLLAESDYLNSLYAFDKNELKRSKEEWAVEKMSERASIEFYRFRI